MLSEGCNPAHPPAPRWMCPGTLRQPSSCGRRVHELPEAVKVVGRYFDAGLVEEVVAVLQGPVSPQHAAEKVPEFVLLREARRGRAHTQIGIPDLVTDDDKQGPLDATALRPVGEDDMQQPYCKPAHGQVVPEEVRRLLYLAPMELPGAVHGFGVSDKAPKGLHCFRGLDGLCDAVTQWLGFLAQHRIEGAPEIADHCLALQLVYGGGVAPTLGGLW
mmetsp:Transcript_66606/g.214634  ORF Transcript_66606/g.214634 Transcript_66606/m.214634 type:complete len:217 (+) Transcript_66606:222-872(+)